MKAGYICEFCPVVYRQIFTRKEAIQHERECRWNPQSKSCSTCTLFGNVEYLAVDDSGRISYPTTTRGCIGKHRPLNSSIITECLFYIPLQ